MLFLFNPSSDANHTDEQWENPMDMLTAEQRSFIDGACDVDKMLLNHANSGGNLSF